MAEPTSTAVSLAAALGGASIALIGIEYHSLIWAIFGALFTWVVSTREERLGRAVSLAFVSALAGALIGSFIWDRIESKSHILLMLLSFASAVGAKSLVSMLVDMLKGVVRRVFSSIEKR